MSKTILNVISALITILVIVEAAFHYSWTSGLDNLHYDLWHKIAGKRSDTANVLIVSIDDKTLLKFRDDPLAFWGPHFGKAISVLRQHGAKSIGLDFLFSVSAESWLKKVESTGSSISRTYDIPFRTQLSLGKVVLSSIIATNEKGENERLMPPFDYWAVMPGMRADIGIGNLIPDPDGVVRGFIPNYGIKTDPTVSFPALLAAKAQNMDVSKAEWLSSGKKIKNANAALPIGFIGPPGTVPRISFADVVSDVGPDARDSSLIKDRIVIIAEENTGSQDIHQTPYSRSFPGLPSLSMTGPEIHANTVETVVSGKYPMMADFWARFSLSFAVIALSMLLFMNSRPILSLLLGLALCAIAISVSLALFMRDIHLPVSGMEAGIVLSYLACLGVKYTGEERRREKLRKIFSRYVSDEVVAKLASSENLPDLGGEVLEITVLFSDIRNFTTISEQLSPREVVEMMNKYLSRACEPILENGGTIDKFIGDAIMAVFGAPAIHADHAERALEAARGLEIIASEFDSWLKKRFSDRHLPEFKIGIGIHTGKALVGNIGSPKRMEYTAMGDVVNTASRLEGLSKTLGWITVVSEETVTSAGLCEKTADGILTGAKETLKVKGREKDVVVYEVASSRSSDTKKDF